MSTHFFSLYYLKFRCACAFSWAYKNIQSIQTVFGRRQNVARLGTQPGISLVISHSSALVFTLWNSYRKYFIKQAYIISAEITCAMHIYWENSVVRCWCVRSVCSRVHSNIGFVLVCRCHIVSMSFFWLKEFNYKSMFLATSYPKA